MTMNLEIRIKRPRTQLQRGTWELLERFANVEGRTAPNCLEWILENPHGWERWREFLNDQRNPGMETT